MSRSWNVGTEGDQPKTHFEVLAEQRDYKRRRQSYRAKNVHITKRSAVEVWIGCQITGHTQIWSKPSLKRKEHPLYKFFISLKLHPDRQTDRQTDWRSCLRTYGRMDRQADGEIDRQADWRTWLRTHERTDRQADGETDRQTDGLAHAFTHKR